VLWVLVEFGGEREVIEGLLEAFLEGLVGEVRGV